MCNFKDDILEAACGEPIEAIAVSISRGWSAGRQPDRDLGASPVPWEIAAPVLDYEYDNGFGGQDCHDIHAWTATRVLFVHEYDGATSVESVPRHPENETGNF